MKGIDKKYIIPYEFNMEKFEKMMDDIYEDHLKSNKSIKVATGRDGVLLYLDAFFNELGTPKDMEELEEILDTLSEDNIFGIKVEDGLYIIG